MKKVFIAAMMLFSLSMVSQAQNVVRENNTFKQVSSSKRGSKTDTLLTTFKWEDSKGTQYPIIVNKQSGRCYVWKKSGKTGKMYKQYMNEYVSKTVCDELGIKYASKQKK